MPTKVFFDNFEDCQKIAKNLDVEPDCEFSLTVEDVQEVKVASNQEEISNTSYSVTEISTPEQQKY